MHPDSMLQIGRDRQAVLLRHAERRRRAGAAGLVRALQRLAARGAMHRDGEVTISRAAGGRT